MKHIDALFPHNKFVYFKETELSKLIKLVYNLSKPQGMGFSHYKSSDLSDEEAQQIIRDSQKRMVREIGDFKYRIIDLDYIHGRACKIRIYHFIDDARIAIEKDFWFDHSREDLENLIKLMETRNEI